MRYIRSIFTGMAFGALANSIILLTMSYYLKLGYYAPCIESIPEYVGGELNGAAVELICMMAAGAGIGAAVAMRSVKLPFKSLIGAIGLVPAVFLICRIMIFI